MFWDNVKTLLKTSPYTQKSLSEMLGYAPRTVEQWILRRSLPDVEDGVRIALALNTTVEFLVTGESSSADKDKLKELKKTLKDLSDSI